MTELRTATIGEPQPLAADFPAADEADWLALVEKALKGRDFEKTLARTNDDGLRLRPLYVGDPNAKLAGHGAPTGATKHMPGRLNLQRPWHIDVEASLSDPLAANRLLLDGLENGASAICLTLHDAPPASMSALAVIDTALEGIRLDFVPVAIDAGDYSLPLAAALVAHCRKKGQSLAELAASFGVDPLGQLAASGQLSLDFDTVMDHAAQTARFVADHDIWAAVIDIRTNPYHLAGASNAQELGIAMATAVAYMRGLERQGMQMVEAAETIAFTLSADAEIFETVAKFRAARLLWARLFEAAGIASPPMFLGADTAERMMSRVDPHVNVLRTTTAAMAAGIGSADSILVKPYDAVATGGQDPLALRMARNIQLILQSEASMGRVVDPAAGAYFIEALTGDVTAKAWAFFQQIEAAGGMLAALRDGTIATMIGPVAAQRQVDIAKRKRPLTGVSEFPDLGTAPLPAASKAAVRPSAAPKAGFETMVNEAAQADLAAMMTPQDAAVITASLPARRLAQSFEDLRDRACRHQPTVFAATLGALPEFNARLLWLRNALAAGGINLSGGDPHGNVAASVAAFAAAGEDIAVICAADAAYEAHLESLVDGLRAAGAAQILVAGRPQATGPEVDGHLYAGCDLVAALSALHGQLGLPAKGDES